MSRIQNRVFKKTKGITFFILLLLVFQACDDGGSGVYYYHDVSLWEYNVATQRKKMLRLIGTNESAPIVQFMHQSNGYVYVRYDQFNIFSEKGVEKVVKLDGWFLSDFHVCISPDDKDIVYSAVRLSDDSPNPSFLDRGLYRLNLANGTTSLVYKVEGENPIYPVYSSDGAFILFKVSSGYPSRLYMINRDGGDKVEIDYNDYNLINNGLFNEDDSKVYYFKSPDGLYEYDIKTKFRKTLVSNAIFGYSMEYRYPNININGGLLYFLTQKSDSCFMANKLYTMNLVTKEIKKLNVTGSPVAFGNNYLLTCGSSMVLKSLKSDAFVPIDSFSHGALSRDESKVIYIKDEPKVERWDQTESNY